MMKKFTVITICFLGFLLSGTVIAQSQIIKLSSELFENDRIIHFSDMDGWYYHHGDNMMWTNPEVPFDQWTPISIELRKNTIPENWSGNGWFRAVVEIDSTLFGKEMGIRGRIYGAMEFYLNGKLIHNAGQIGSNSQSEVTSGYFEPINFEWGNTEIHHIAIRYSNHNYRKAWERAPVGPILFLGDSESIFTSYQQRQSEYRNHLNIYRIQIGFFLALALIHLILFGYYPSEKANLIYGALMLAVLAISWSSSLLGTLFKPEDFINYVLVESVSAILFGVLNLFFAYHITNRKLNWVPKLFLIFGIVILVFIVINPVETRVYSTFFLYLSFLTTIGIFIWDRIKHSRKDLNIILYSYLIFFVLFFPRTFAVTTGIFFLWAENQTLFNYITFIIPIGYSIYLARSIAQLNFRLSQKLKENEKLTTEKIAIERERQQLIQSQKEELEKEVVARTSELKESLEELKATQAQLVQQEKLASLGQLTAGIAHEIKNPLNFVNNFSDLSIEMVEEARDELSAVSGQLSAKDARQVKETLKILNDIEVNLKKIHEHGSRADSIVKSMLQHSRGGTGKMEPTDLNGLVKEYVNLSFHGMRASKHPINVDIEMELDEEIGQVPLIREDFSRVIVNLCNNAFDAMRDESAQSVSDPRVSEKADWSEAEIPTHREGRSAPSVSDPRVSEKYSPQLTIRTNLNNNTITIEIIDNGPGIPDEIKDKILQPFFTTKKGTAGTGLGLSITNDIIKAHGGELDIKTSQSKGTTFTIHLKPQK